MNCLLLDKGIYPENVYTFCIVLSDRCIFVLFFSKPFVRFDPSWMMMCRSLPSGTGRLTGRCPSARPTCSRLLACRTTSSSTLRISATWPPTVTTRSSSSDGCVGHFALYVCLYVVHFTCCACEKAESLVLKKVSCYSHAVQFN